MFYVTVSSKFSSFASNIDLSLRILSNNSVSICFNLVLILLRSSFDDAMFKNDLEFNASWEPYIGFSDDDLRNIEKIKELISKEYEESPVNLYLTKGGNKTRY